MAYRLRETRIIASSELHDANGKKAEVLTYAVRKLGGTWKFKTAVVGWRGDEGRAWFGEWDDWDAAKRGHDDTCQKIHQGQGVTLQ